MTVFTELYERALSTGLVQKSVDDIVSLVLARSGQLKRIFLKEASEEESPADGTVFEVLEGGIAMVRQGEASSIPSPLISVFMVTYESISCCARRPTFQTREVPC